MAAASTYTTAGTTLVKGYRKVASKLYHGFKSATDEYKWFDDFPEEDITFSAREMLIPLDLNKAFGTAMIPEAGFEAITVTPALEEGTVTWVNMNQRFTISLTSKALDQRGKDGQVIRQVKYQSLKAVEAMARRVGIQTYGFSSGIVCLTSTNATQASGVYTLIDAFGVGTLDNAAYIAAMFSVGDNVALIRSDALVANALGVITAVTAATPSITVTWAGSVDSDANDAVVFANAVTDATITASDYNRWPVGLLDIATSTSVHGLSGASVPNWTAALNNSSGGRFDFVKLKKGRQALFNRGGKKLTDIIWSNGIENDVEAGERAAVRYGSSGDMDLDGKVRSKGVTFRTSGLVPPGCVFGFDRDAISNFSLMDKPAEDGLIDFGSMDKAEDRNALKASLDFAYARMVRSRAGLFLYSGLTEQ